MAPLPRSRRSSSLGCTLLLLIAWQLGVASADPREPPSPCTTCSTVSPPNITPDPPPPVAAAAPLVDVAHVRAERSRYAKPIAAAGVALIYGAFSTWAYYAWFHGREPVNFAYNHSWFGLDTYAGGADKFGHFWATYVLAGATTHVLVAGGWDVVPSSLVGSALSLFLFTLSEVQDGYVGYTFETGDQIANTTGAMFSILMRNIPELDRLIDFRVEYHPSPEYWDSLTHDGNIDVANDYTGQSYMLAFHLNAVPRLTDPSWMRWARFADAVVGFETRNFRPAPADPTARREQTVYVGVALNMQQVLSSLFCDCTGRRIGRGLFEVMSVPYTTLRFADLSRTGPPM